jgi:hypothetical protein
MVFWILSSTEVCIGKCVAGGGEGHEQQEEKKGVNVKEKKKK